MTIHDIQRLVASRMGATALDLVSARQASARPRQVAMWLARHTTPASFPAIGRAFGNRDHTTVMQACRRVDALMAADPAFAAVVSELRGAVA
jgi:chromosomal replication initiator protein